MMVQNLIGLATAPFVLAAAALLAASDAHGQHGLDRVAWLVGEIRGQVAEVNGRAAAVLPFCDDADDVYEELADLSRDLDRFEQQLVRGITHPHDFNRLAHLADKIEEHACEVKEELEDALDDFDPRPLPPPPTVSPYRHINHWSQWLNLYSSGWSPSRALNWYTSRDDDRYFVRRPMSDDVRERREERAERVREQRERQRDRLEDRREQQRERVERQRERVEDQRERQRELLEDRRERQREAREDFYDDLEDRLEDRNRRVRRGGVVVPVQPPLASRQRFGQPRFQQPRFQQPRQRGGSVTFGRPGFSITLGNAGRVAPPPFYAEPVPQPIVVRRPAPVVVGPQPRVAPQQVTELRCSVDRLHELSAALERHFR